MVLPSLGFAAAAALVLLGAALCIASPTPSIRVNEHVVCLPLTLEIPSINTTVRYQSVRVESKDFVGLYCQGETTYVHAVSVAPGNSSAGSVNFADVYSFFPVGGECAFHYCRANPAKLCPNPVAVSANITFQGPDCKRKTPGIPEQVHLALGYEISQMAVAWATYEDVVGGTATTKSVVEWGLSKARFSNQATGDALPFADVDEMRDWTTHAATMTGLKPDTTYFYRVGDPGFGFSPIFSFRSQKTLEAISAPGAKPQRHLVFGDMGSGYAFTLCKACTGHPACTAEMCATNQTAGLVGELSTADMMLHVGDFGYNLDDLYGLVGDQFMRNIEQLAAHVPYMVSIGNHEDSDKALAHFTNRFRHMPTTTGVVPVMNGNLPNTWYYSWDAGLVHYIAISTEIPYEFLDMVEQQWTWLKQDLEKANANRDKVPWIIVHGHRGFYCSCDDSCISEGKMMRLGPYGNGTFGFETLFFESGVDMYLCGHYHDYERNWPTYQNVSVLSNDNPKAPIYIITGAAGSQELHEPFKWPQPRRAAFRSNTFSYSRLIIHNKTHINYQQVMTDPTFFASDAYGRVIDDFWVRQSHHGPFNQQALQEAADADVDRCLRGDCPVPGDIDHWSWLSLGQTSGLEPGSKFKDDTNEKRLQDFVQRLGDSRMGTKWEDANVAYYQEHHIEPTVLPPELDHRPAAAKKQQTTW